MILLSNVLIFMEEFPVLFYENYRIRGFFLHEYKFYTNVMSFFIFNSAIIHYTVG